MKHRKHKKRSRQEESSSESSSDQSPPPDRGKNREMKSKEERARKHHVRDDSPPAKHKKSHRREEQMFPEEEHKRHKSKKTEGKRERDGGLSKHSRDSHQKEKHNRQRTRERTPSPPVKVKKEEDFDKRQEELRRKRREQARPSERHPADIRIKQEPQSDDERRQRNSRPDNSRDGRDRSRRNIEQDRRRNDARRAEEWQRREREGGGNAEALRADPEPPKDKEKPNLGLSGALTEDTNTFRGVVIKYNEPPEARVPKKKWRLYPFKGDEALKVLHLHRQSAYLLGKLRRIADIPIDHPSCSKQHAVFQFRLVEETRDDGRTRRIVKPYIIDLESANGTYVNNQKIDPRRYVELKEQDVVKFGFSSREYVLIHDKSDTSQVADSDKSSDEESD